jgi:zinc/manganese transport system permease protein
MIDISILLPAFITGMLVLLTHVPLGQRVLQRGIIFIDLALAQIAGLGIVLAFVLGFEPHGYGVQIVATSSALLGAGLLYLLEQHFSQVLEALIGLIFILAATAVALLVSHQPQGSHEVDTLLNGQILWVNYQQLLPAGILYALVLLLWFMPWWRSQRFKFYILFALSVTASVQLVGVYLVFASLIIPALAVRGCQRYPLVWGYFIGVLGYLLGIAGSALFDLPTGPLIVWSLLATAGLFKLLGVIQARTRVRAAA